MFGIALSLTVLSLINGSLRLISSEKGYLKKEIIFCGNLYIDTYQKKGRVNTMIYLWSVLEGQAKPTSFLM